MSRITTHHILDTAERGRVEFSFRGNTIRGEKGFTIAAALHRAGYPVHSHSLHNRSRSLECGIGKCGACEMLVDNKIKRICITLVDGVGEVAEIPTEYRPETLKGDFPDTPFKIYRTEVAIIGAGPAGLSVRSKLNQHKIPNIVIDNNPLTGGQFLMQTHQFFFFEKEKKFGGMRGFDIAESLAGESHDGIFTDSTVWDIFEGRRLAVKNIRTGGIYYVDANHLVVATGAVPFMPAFENDDLPGVYTAAVVQKMMNIEYTLLGKKVLTVGAGNIGYLTSYQLMQAGADVKAIVEAMAHEGGFPVQANRVKRLGIPVLLSHMLVKAIPNAGNDGIIGAVVARCSDFEPVAGTERVIKGIDAINICTGLVPDDSLLIKGKELFGRDCYGVGDALRIGEGTSAVLRGEQVAYEILENIQAGYNYNDYLQISKEYIDSQQHPVKVLDEPFMPGKERSTLRPFVIIDCLWGFACNPCQFACPHGAITKSSTATVPYIDFEKCTGCMECVWQCPGLAIFGFNLKNGKLFLPLEYPAESGREVYLVDKDGAVMGDAVIEKILVKPNKTNIARIGSISLSSGRVTDVRGFILRDRLPVPLRLDKLTTGISSEKYICHCDDVTLDEILDVIGARRFISVDEIKHTTRLGMGACRGKRCIKRLSNVLQPRNISLVGEATPRAPMSNQLNIGELVPSGKSGMIITGKSPGSVPEVKVDALIAGGGIGGSALFRYFAESGIRPVLINYGRGASWRNIAGGRPAFSIPELSEIAARNQEIFRELERFRSIDYHPTRYVTFAHDEELLQSLEASIQWSDSEMIAPSDFKKRISPHINGDVKNYISALVTDNCWQASPGKTVDLIRTIGEENGGEVVEDCRLIDLWKEGETFYALVQDHNREYVTYVTNIFVNALGSEGELFSNRLGYYTGLYPVRHQAFITRRLPMMGVGGMPLPMLIDRRSYKGFTAVYGQQLYETGQIIGCASPFNDPDETNRNLNINSKEFMEIVGEVFTNWIPGLSNAGFQAIWSGYYIEPRMVIDPEKGLFTGLRGQGFMLAQYLAKLYVDKINGRPLPAWFDRLAAEGDGLEEKAFK